MYRSENMFADSNSKEDEIHICDSCDLLKVEMPMMTSQILKSGLHKITKI